MIHNVVKMIFCCRLLYLSMIKEYSGHRECAFESKVAIFRETKLKYQEDKAVIYEETSGDCGIVGELQSNLSQ